MKPNYISKEGLENLKKELHYLETTERKELSEKLAKAIAFGDLSENAAYHEAKESQSFLEGKILELKSAIKNAVIITENKNKDCVSIGCRVELNLNGEKIKFQIVGAQESNPSEGKISNESPLGRALLGRRKGEIVDVDAPSGKIKYKIEKIE